ncbi:MAG: NAD(P)H-dependent glycerol-3-phosphate dehydrogenase [Alphaproteobacteria bacterium]
MNIKISIIGAGAWGTALAKAFSHKAEEIIVWGRSDISEDLKNLIEKNNRKNIKFTMSITQALENNILFLAIPAQKIRNFFKNFNGKLENYDIVICSKGIEKYSLKLMSEVLKELAPNNNILVLTGPNFASEIMLNLPAATIIAAENLKIAQKIADSLSCESFSLYASDDVISAQIGGALKNIIAIACGITIGLEFGENARSAIITGGIAEIFKLARLKGGQLATIMGLSGIGDLNLTCNSSKSRNLKFGLDSVLNRQIPQNSTIEGVESCISVKQLIDKYELNLPICQFVYDYIYNNKEAIMIKEIINNLSLINGIEE